MIEWSSHDVYDHRVSLLPQGGANCYRWEFANWRKILQIDGFIKGMLKKATSGVPCLRRSGYAQAGRLFVVLTYSMYAPRVKQRRGPAGPRQRFAALLDGLF